MVFSFLRKKRGDDPANVRSDSGFALKGAAGAVREAGVFDKKEADRAFSRYSKETISGLLGPLGFEKAGKAKWMRINPVGLLEYIDLQKEARGSMTFTVNSALLPMYVKCDYICIGFGNRIGRLICDRDVWWGYGNDGEAKASFQNAAEAIELFVIPWFAQYGSESAYREKLVADIESGSVLTYPSKEWLEALDSSVRDEGVVRENAAAWNVPKNLVDGYLANLAHSVKGACE